MAHELATFIDGRARMAYVGDTPWHGLGQALTPNAPLETWATEAGMNFTIGGSPVLYQRADKTLAEQGSKQVLYREDTGEALGVVGNKYKVVQPIEVLEFFRDLVAEQGFQLETAGVLFNGAKYWAMARTGQEFKIGKNDVLKDYLMLATACDGTLRTTARRTSVRVVCNNTLTLSNKDALGDCIVACFTPRFNSMPSKGQCVGISKSLTVRSKGKLSFLHLAFTLCTIITLGLLSQAFLAEACDAALHLALYSGSCFFASYILRINPAKALLCSELKCSPGPYIFAIIKCIELKSYCFLSAKPYATDAFLEKP